MLGHSWDCNCGIVLEGCEQFETGSPPVSEMNMHKRPNEALIAPCGINCGVCKYYLAKAKGIYKSRRSGCIGCVPRGKGCVCQGCEPLTKGNVRFCYECRDFPCKQLERLNQRYRTKYHTDLISNLLNIKKKGITDWLKEEEQRWKCNECGGMVSMHDLRCYDCGVEQSK